MYNLPSWPLLQPSLDAEDVHHVQDLHKRSKVSWQPHTFPEKKKNSNKKCKSLQVINVLYSYHSKVRHLENINIKSVKFS